MRGKDYVCRTLVRRPTLRTKLKSATRVGDRERARKQHHAPRLVLAPRIAAFLLQLHSLLSPPTGVQTDNSSSRTIPRSLPSSDAAGSTPLGAQHPRLYSCPSPKYRASPKYISLAWVRLCARRFYPAGSREWWRSAGWAWERSASMSRRM